VLTTTDLKSEKIGGVQDKRQTIEHTLQMLDNCGVCGVEHADATVVLLIQTNYPAAALDYDGNIAD